MVNYIQDYTIAFHIYNDQVICDCFPKISVVGYASKQFMKSRNSNGAYFSKDTYEILSQNTAFLKIK